ncbi:MAG: hypothetical protein QF441_03220 [Bacteriovoracaceae bacterium]|jgi:hypothetical protein|nr:hypothetical protein [Halobacteriovoraceae bacterium]MDP7319587.1 hypothetical protein [Bacteriovoracaceae bacterium]|tara:strand:+ start:451 stop:870 length:420 start_codon:yes stop_codon:yes gene_type:complete
MLIGGLSEQEVQKIKRLLETENISYLIKTDTSILETNSESIQHNLRHLNSPSISTHILAIELSEDAFNKMSQKLKNELLEFGVSDEVPQELELTEETPQNIQSEITKGNKRIIGHNLLHQIMLFAGAFIIYLVFKSFLL